MEPAALDLSDDKQSHADERLRSDHIIWLGTVRPDSKPHLVPVWFLWDGATVLIFSKPDQKIRNLKQNPNVTLAVDDSKEGEDAVLIDGEATLLDPGEVNSTLPAYAQKYAAMLTEMGWTAASMAGSYTQPIRVTPTRFRFY